MRHGNLNGEMVGLRRGLALPLTPAEAAQQARREAEVSRDLPPPPERALRHEGEEARYGAGNG